MKDESDRMAANRTPSRPAGYRSPRQPKLRGQPSLKPHRLATAAEPSPAAEEAPIAPAAPESIEGFEADYGDGLAELGIAEEATVTIVEIDPVAALAAHEPAAPRPLRAGRGEVASAAPTLDDEALLGPIEEATVEIVELPAEPPIEERASRRKRDNHH
jgi:hypothetical protein